MSDLISFVEGVGLTLLVKGEVYKFMSTVFDASSEAIVKFLENEVRCFNLERVAKALENSFEELKKAGLEPRAVSYKYLLPILEGISLEEESYLQKKWTKLLSSAVLTGEIHPSYPSILSDLGSLDSKILDKIAELESAIKPREVSEFGVFVELLREFNVSEVLIKSVEISTNRVSFKSGAFDSLSESEMKDYQEAREIFSESVDNLERLKLIYPSGERPPKKSKHGTMIIGGWGYKRIELTSFGQRFLKVLGTEFSE
ncbi:hypothetical protein C7293_27455 [filamentous cyanobacterium CCT1]|nr:hypothetical protein C7293_27455 [filamentous cyanobacterium CCT1]PSN77250.1 hypothetical protein C8B47_23045 [filamentous cyanobacterium CCP4]